MYVAVGVTAGVRRTLTVRRGREGAVLHCWTASTRGTLGGDHVNCGAAAKSAPLAPSALICMHGGAVASYGRAGHWNLLNLRRCRA